MKKKVAIYVRVSTTEQVEHGYSIQDQKDKLIQFCDLNDWPKYDIYEDAGISGATTNRPDLQRLLSEIDKYSLVLVYKLDRLTRNVRDLLDLLDTFESNGVAFRSATEVYDTSNALGRLFVTLVGAIAEWERTTIKERTVSGRKASMRSGNYVQQQPFYYDKVDGKLVLNEHADVMRWIINQLKQGVAASQIAKQLNASKHNTPINRKWSKTAVLRLFRSPVARGHSKFGEYIIENTHEPIMTESEYQSIEKRLKSSVPKRKQRYPFIFRGLLVCPQCGHRFSQRAAKTKYGGWVRTCYCDYCKKSDDHKYISAPLKEFERAFIAYMRNLDLSQFEIVADREENDSVKIDIEKVKRQREKYSRAWSMELLTDDEYFKLMAETDELMEDYTKQQQLTEKPQHDLKAIEDAQTLIMDAWGYLSMEEKEELLRAIITRIEVEVEQGIKGRGGNVTIRNIEFAF